MDLGDRVVGTPVRAKPIRARLEVRLEDGFQHCFQAGLGHSVGDGGDAELAHLARRPFRDHHASHLNRLELTGFQRVPDPAQEGLDPDPGFDKGHRDLVDARGPGAGVGSHALPRMDQERRVIDEVEQVVKPAGRIGSRPTMQLGLHPPYRESRRTGIRPIHSADIHRRVFGHCVPPSPDTLPPFPMCWAFPSSE